MNDAQTPSAHDRTTKPIRAFPLTLGRLYLGTALLCLGAFAAQSIQAASPGPIFPLFGGTQLATRPDGTTFLVETYDECVEPVHELYREIRVGTLALGGTNLASYQVRADVTSPRCRFPAYNPDVAANSTNAVIAYTDKAAVVFGEPHAFDILYSFLGTNGALTEPRVAALETRSWHNALVTSRIAMNPSGDFAIVYYYGTETSESYARGRLFFPDGVPKGAFFTVNQTPDAYGAVVALSASGISVYAWEEAITQKYNVQTGLGQIYARLVDAVGNPTGNQFRVNTTLNGRHSEPEIAIGPDGSFAVVWTRTASDANGVILRRFGPTGLPLGPELRVSPPNGTDPQVAISADGRCVVAWRGQDGDGGGIFAQRFLADGSFYRNALWINEGRSGDQSNPLLGIADDGQFIIKWSEGANHFAQWLTWEATNSIQVLGPRIRSLAPDLPVAGSIVQVTVQFDRVMDASSFEAADAQLIDPLGRVVPVNSLTTINNQDFTLHFPAQSLPGRYQIRVGPNIQDGSGESMDENGNSIKGEVNDFFAGEIFVAITTPAAFPISENFENGPDSLLSWSFVSYDGPTLTGVIVVTNEVTPSWPWSPWGNAPHEGTNQLWMRTPPRSGSSQSATLLVDLSAQASATNLFLSYWVAATPFFLEMSGDGENWHIIKAMNDYQPAYTEFHHDLDQAAATNGISLASPVYLRFRQTSYSDYFADIATLFLDEVRIRAGDAGGPRVIGHSPTQVASSANGLNTITVSFDKAIDPATFSGTDVVLKDPQGIVVEPVIVSPVSGSGNQQFALTFANRTVRGTYRLTVGPELRDSLGNAMNQDGDISNGEPSDFYSGTIEYASTVLLAAAPPLLYADGFESWLTPPTYWSFVSFDGYGLTGAIAVTNEVTPSWPLSPWGNAPHEGTNQLWMRTPPRAGSSQSATLLVDLSAQADATNLFLSYWVAATPFFLEISGDGENWHIIEAMNDYRPAYTEFHHDLDDAAATNGISLASPVYLRFRQASYSDYFADIATLFLDEVRIGAGDADGPRMISHSPAQLASATSALNTITVSFDKAIDPATISGTDVVLKDPQGVVVDPVIVSPVSGSGNQQFALTFSDRTVRGTYRLTVGPNLRDSLGNAMNQDGDISNGEPSDFYSGTIEYAPTVLLAAAPPLLYADGFEGWLTPPTYWSFVTFDGPTLTGVIVVTNEVIPSWPLSPWGNAPHEGTNQLWMRTPPRAGSSQSATVLVDLSAQADATNLFLSYWVAATPFFLEISGDGENWHIIEAMNDYRPAYTEFHHDLDDAAATNGISLASPVYLRFRQASYSDYFADIATLFLDEVRIGAGDPNAPILGVPSPTPGGGFQFQLAGPVGNQFVIEASTNLTAWLPISTNMIPANGVLTITDSSATNFNARFYRATVR